MNQTSSDASPGPIQWRPDNTPVTESFNDSVDKFSNEARISQSLKRAMMESTAWHLLDPVQREALELIAHHISCILTHDADVAYGWLRSAAAMEFVAHALTRHTPRDGE